MMLFRSIINSRWFTKATPILFLNKMDLFKSKIVSSPISNFFPDYTDDPVDVTRASRFFQEEFESLGRDQNKVLTTPETAYARFRCLVVTNV
jgi:guanine nucleotide-binding protein subunit alpha